MQHFQLYITHIIADNVFCVYEYNMYELHKAYTVKLSVPHGKLRICELTPIFFNTSMFKSMYYVLDYVVKYNKITERYHDLCFSQLFNITNTTKSPTKYKWQLLTTNHLHFTQNVHVITTLKNVQYQKCPDERFFVGIPYCGYFIDFHVITPTNSKVYIANAMENSKLGYNYMVQHITKQNILGTFANEEYITAVTQSFNGDIQFYKTNVPHSTNYEIDFFDDFHIIIAKNNTIIDVVNLNENYTITNEIKSRLINANLCDIYERNHYLRIVENKVYYLYIPSGYTFVIDINMSEYHFLTLHDNFIIIANNEICKMIHVSSQNIISLPTSMKHIPKLMCTF